MNRGSSKLPRPPGRGLIASMRPRFMNRGSSLGQFGEHGAVHRFNEAPIHESGK